MFVAQIFAFVTLSCGPPPEAVALPTHATIKVNGVLDEAIWSQAPLHRLDHQKMPRTGRASVLTTWKMLVTEDTLFVAIRAQTRPDLPIVARRTRRDREVESDRVTIDIDTRGRGKDAFHFEVTAGGSLVDGIRYNDTVLDLQWDGNWDAAVKRDSGGWTTEVAIPLKLLRRPRNATAPITLQVRRYTSVLAETDEWVPTPRDNSQEVSAYGTVAGFDLQSRPVTGRLLPYLATGTVVETGTGAPVEYITRVGADANLQFGSDTSIDATAYPDFGTVEADTAVFNLTPTEVRFPEKRPFFLEGTDVLSTPLELFYSRRIGSLTGTTAGTVLDAPPPAPVLGAVKLLSRAGEKWTFASLFATSHRQDVAVRDDTNGEVSNQRIAPVYTYGVLRALRDLPNAGSVGLMGTSRFSFDQGPIGTWSHCPDGKSPSRNSCFADVYAAGPDLRLRSRGGTWIATGQVVGTLRQGGTERSVPDGTTLASGDLGMAVHSRIEKAAGRVIGWARYEYFGQHADWNATGFLPRPNQHAARAHLGVQTLTPHGFVLEDRWQVEIFERFTLGGLQLGHGYQINYRATWNTFWRTFTEFQWRPRRFDNRETHDGAALERAGLVGLEQSIASDHRRPLVARFAGTFQQRSNGPRVEADLTIDVNILGPIQLRLGTNGTIERGEPRWIESDAINDRHRFARLNAHALSLLARFNYTITPKLELQVFGQLLGVGTIFHNGFSSPRNDTIIHLDELSPDPSFTSQRRSEALLVANLFLRWEFMTGSNLYLVATRNQLNAADPEGAGGIDFRSVGGSSAAYTLLVKVATLLGR